MHAVVFKYMSLYICKCVDYSLQDVIADYKIHGLIGCKGACHNWLKMLARMLLSRVCFYDVSNSGWGSIPITELWHKFRYTLKIAI